MYSDPQSVAAAAHALYFQVPRYPHVSRLAMSQADSLPNADQRGVSHTAGGASPQSGLRAGVRRLRNARRQRVIAGRVQESAV